MKNFQQNLLVALALGLCALCVWQWYGQARQRAELLGLNQLVYQKDLAIRDDTNSIATLDHQVDQMDASLTELKAVSQRNADLVMGQKRQINQLQFTAAALTNQIAAYLAGIDTLKADLTNAYSAIQKQNDAVKELASQRDEFVKKYNDSVKDRNDIVAKYNELAAQVEKMQTNSSR